MPEKTEVAGGLPAELIVAGQFAEKGWNIYSPHRDIGFDFIATKMIDEEILIRPVQVKGCYPSAFTDRTVYGKGTIILTQKHPEMVLAMPFFITEDGVTKMERVAFLPCSQLKRKPDGNYRSQPASIKDQKVIPRPHFQKFFDGPGLNLLENMDWKDSLTGMD